MNNKALHFSLIDKILRHSYSNNLYSVKIRNLKDEAKDDSDESGIDDK